ncbi:MAG: type II toxin-antitoxin system Phd/YefM family antitoxin [Candidatus Eremiobacteraeota bacterium]|nr:type II toxin-antitoxin system Phd/YefM family antitoxin [Candidatus Eremiobacteraeota bacterium]MCW5866537.1 type II toxin-antitoxin system Phd/YefM family antitoxin [Candidatus Eremiobacteraeota bacterium]
MKTVTIHEAKTHLSRLIQEVLAGEEVIIARGRTPVVRLVVHQEPRRTRSLGRPGSVLYMADDFDAPLEDFKEYQ